jgi:hypothetical protein
MVPSANRGECGGNHKCERNGYNDDGSAHCPLRPGSIERSRKHTDCIHDDPNIRGYPGTDMQAADGVKHPVTREFEYRNVLEGPVQEEKYKFIPYEYRNGQVR